MLSIDVVMRGHQVVFRISDGESESEVVLSIDKEQAMLLADEAANRPGVSEAAEYITRAYMVLPGPNEAAAELAAERAWSLR